MTVAENKNCVLCDRSLESLIWAGVSCRVILVQDENYPGFCRVIWQDHVKEMTDLSEVQRTDVMRIVWHVESAIRSVMQPDKINVASLGNQVPHVHWHIIPRYQDDVHFPNLIWASAQRAPDAQRIAERQTRLPELRATIHHLLAQEK